MKTYMKTISMKFKEIITDENGKTTTQIVKRPVKMNSGYYCKK